MNLKMIGYADLRAGVPLRTGGRQYSCKPRTAKIYGKLGTAKGVASGRPGVAVYPVYVDLDDPQHETPSAPYTPPAKPAS